MRHAISVAGGLVLLAGSAAAECTIDNDTPLQSLTNSFEAWKVVTDEMAECGNFTAVLDNEFRQKQAPAFAASPPLYQIGGVADGDFTPLIQQNLARPLDDLVERYGEQLRPNQFIQVDGEIMAIAMMINNQHLMYRADILEDLGIEVPATYDELLAAAAKIEEAGVVEYPLGATYMSGWNLAKDFTNMYLAMGGAFFDEDDRPTIANETGVAAIETMKAVTRYLDPEFLVSDSTYVQQQFQQGKIAMANFWASRAAAVIDPEESAFADRIAMAAAPAAVEGGPPCRDHKLERHRPSARTRRRDGRDRVPGGLGRHRRGDGARASRRRRLDHRGLRADRGRGRRDRDRRSGRRADAGQRSLWAHA